MPKTVAANPVNMDMHSLMAIASATVTKLQIVAPHTKPMALAPSAVRDSFTLTPFAIAIRSMDVYRNQVVHVEPVG
jgi:hypothetical protein